MKILSLSAICAIALASCSSNQSTTEADSVAADSAMYNVNTAPGQVCFLHTDGTANQDSTLVHLIINGSKVTGEMKWLPQEKDSRSGTLEGTQEGNTIKAVWRFMQEGMTDTLAVEFDFPGDELLQKPFMVNEVSGREQTDAKADYSIIFNKVDCK